jgi:opacity protein-like surface antigen
MQFNFKNTLLSVAILATVNLSAETSSIIGVEGVYNKIDAQEPALGTNYNQSTGGIGIRLGAQSDDFRFLLIYESIQDQTYNGATVSQYMITGNLDYFIPIQTQTIKPFVGAIFGQSQYKISSYSDTDFVYGGEIGVDFNVYKHFSVDLFGRYTTAQLNAVNHYIQSGIGLNYKF